MSCGVLSLAQAPVWFDSHCHFDFEAFDTSRSEHWALAQRHHVQGCLVPGVSRALSESRADRLQGIPHGGALGLHPYWMNEHRQADLDWLDSSLADVAFQRSASTLSSEIVAVGETGLDRPLAKRGGPSLREQMVWFDAQCALAHTHRLPLILHAVGTHQELIHHLRACGFTQGGMVHGFTGSEEQARQWLDLGFVLGVGGAISRPNASRLRALFQYLPVDALLLETDGPDMPPAFLAGSRGASSGGTGTGGTGTGGTGTGGTRRDARSGSGNHHLNETTLPAINGPAMIPLLGAILARIRKLEDLSQLALTLQQNAYRIFPRLTLNSSDNSL